MKLSTTTSYRGIIMVLLLICTFERGYGQRSATVQQKVKTTNSYFISSEDGVLWPQTWRVISQTFTPAPSRTISPLASDPGVVTPNPYIISTCPVLPPGGGLQQAVMFSATFNSLRDIGTWHITFDGTWFDPSTCASAYYPPCNILCDPLITSNWSNTFTYHIEVMNSAPSGNITFSPTPAWNATVTLNDNGSDPDGGIVTHHWAILERPTGSTTTLSSTTVANPTIAFSSERDIGHWRFRAEIDDDEGERRTFEAAFAVPNVRPNISLGVSPGNPLDAGQVLAVTASPITDVDGGDLTFDWTVNGPRTLPGAPFTNSGISFTTTEADITTYSNGTDFRPPWQFHCVARDNEKDTDTKSVTVKVRNKPPRITDTFDNNIDVGESIAISSSTLTDEDGGNLEFKWDMIQKPHNGSAEGVPSGWGSTSNITIGPTGILQAGTWIIRLTARDNEGEEVKKDFTVLVDAEPEAFITGIPVSNRIGTLTGFPFTLHGDTSVDPDSPPNCPGSSGSNCHDTSEPPVQISPDITSYTWYLIDAPLDNPDIVVTGPVDEVFNIPAHRTTLEIPVAYRLRPGMYTFQLEVKDGEDNKAYANYQLEVIDESAPPFAVVLPPYIIDNIDATGVIHNDITLNGGFSFDPDNLLSGTGGPNISNYQWSIIDGPPGCTSPPAMPSGATATTAPLFTAGSSIHPACQGVWRFGLTVTDDDTPSKTNVNVAEAVVVIGNCASNLCIDYPTTANPKIIDFVEGTDVMIYFHLNSALYATPGALAGTVARLQIFHESDPATAFHTADDPALLPSDLGGYLVFHWNGYGTGNQRPRPGKYHVNIILLNESLGVSLGGASQVNAIKIATATPAIAATSQKYADHESLEDNSDSFEINYTITGGASPDALQWKVYDLSNSEVASGSLPNPASTGTFTWNGRNTGGTLVSAGQYKLELETIRGGASMGKSPHFNLTVYRITISKSGTPATPILASPPGMLAQVNSDDDDNNNTADLLEAATGENDLQAIKIQIEPAIAGNLIINTSDGGKMKLWTTALKSAEVVLPKTYTLPAEMLPTELFMEARGSGQPPLSVQMQTTDAVTLPAKRAAFTFVDVKVMQDGNNDFRITAVDNQTLFVRPGLWDNSFRLAADPLGAINTLYNEEDESRIAATGNPENYVGRDSRRFYFQVEDPTANADPATIEEIPAGQFNFYTVKADNSADDSPSNQSIHLIETGPNTGIFVSKAAMLVTGTVDRDQPTNTGITAHAGSASYNQHNHRTRSISEPDGSLKVEYTPAATGIPFYGVSLPVFNRSPEERKVMTIRIFNFADPLNLAIPAVPQTTIDNYILRFKSIYATCGIRIEVLYNPATDIINLSMGSTVNLNNVAGFTGGHGTLAPSADQSNLISLARAVDPASAANANTLYVMLIKRFTTATNTGQSFPDGWLPTGSIARNFVFIASNHPSGDWRTPSHEIGHMVTNQTLTAGEANGSTPGWGGGGHYQGPHDDFNLMHPSPHPPTFNTVSENKRLWDDTATHLIQQITRIRGTRFLRNP